MNLSIIFPVNNEGQAFIDETVRSIRETIDIEGYEIIVVDDCSDTPITPKGADLVIRNDHNLGVGASFDVGAEHAKSENLFIMGCDIRFEKNGWASKMIEETDKHYKSFICTTCVAYKEGVPFKDSTKYYGAKILFFHDHISNPGAKQRRVLEAEWIKDTIGRKSYEIPCILGAAYGVKKSWYNYVDGWWGHKQWGTLEPYISLKSWLFGGSCRIAPDIETGHIFKPAIMNDKENIHRIKSNLFIYNKLLTNYLFFDGELYDKMDAMMLNSITKINAQAIFDENRAAIEKKKKEYSDKFEMTIKEFCDRWGVDVR